MRKYHQNLSQAKKAYNQITGMDYDKRNLHPVIKIFKLKIMKTKTRRYFVGTYTDWLNL